MMTIEERIAERAKYGWEHIEVIEAVETYGEPTVNKWIVSVKRCNVLVGQPHPRFDRYQAEYWTEANECHEAEVSDNEVDLNESLIPIKVVSRLIALYEAGMKGEG